MSLPIDLFQTSQLEIQRLIDDQVREGQYLEFKREFPSKWNDKAKKEFLADVTAFANSGGGDIIYGIEENHAGEAAAMCPLVHFSADLEILRLQDFLMTEVDPRISGIQYHPLKVTVSAIAGHVLIIRIPQSWEAPHRVETDHQVSVREGPRKRTLNVPELRALFVRTDSQAQRIRDFRTDRLAKVLTGDTPTLLEAGPKLVVHVIPTQAALGLVQINPVPYSRGTWYLPMIPRTNGFPATLNFDGAFVIRPLRDQRKDGYTQLFRQGYFEAVWVLRTYYGFGGPVLPGAAYEDYVNQFLDQVRGELDRHGLRGDMAVFLSLLDADRVVFAGPSDGGPKGPPTRHQFDRDSLLLPEVLIPAEVAPGRGMRPAYDLMCQSAGLEGSINYGPDDEWKAHDRP